MIHLTKECRKIIEELKISGLNGIFFDHLKLQEEKLEDFYGELTAKTFAERQRDYVCIIAEANLYRLGTHEESKYVEHTVNDKEFYYDLKVLFQSRLGPNIIINFSNGCNEYEIYRDKK